MLHLGYATSWIIMEDSTPMINSIADDGVNLIELPGYSNLEKIVKSGNYILFRGERERDNQKVLIKMSLTEPGDSDLTYEYEFIKNLDLRGVAKPLAYEKFQCGLALIYRDIKGFSLKALIDSHKISMRTFLEIAISISDTIEILHLNNIIHKDIKPDHFLISEDNSQAWCIDLRFATILPKENPSTIKFGKMEGTLSYMSPEQTGRMNRILDYRTDFYSLGVLLFEMLTGRLPFPTKDPLELVHCHIAQEPETPHEVDPNIPIQISDIVMKLMSKTAENRYQSAKGIKRDLEECLIRLQLTGMIGSFALGWRDYSETFQISQKLYGRDQELQVLLKAFEQVKQGQHKMIMISGYTGIGKTTLVQEAYKTGFSKKGFFISADFDQFRRTNPYSPIIHGIQELIKEILNSEKSNLTWWKEKFLDAIGTDGQIIIDAIPELEMIIGPQPSVPKLDPAESRNRFNFIILNFIRVFCNSDYPFVIFLDDLQWVDNATLNLINLIMMDKDTQHLLIIGAYRDNEVNENHDLIKILDSLKSEGAPIEEVHIGTIRRDDVLQLLIDTFNTDSKKLVFLAGLVMQKTRGNPFFVSQFMTNLYQKGLFHFDIRAGQWHWDLTQIKKQHVAEDVIDFLIGQLDEMPSETRKLLSTAACFGNRFDLKSLVDVTGGKRKERLDALMPALQEGLIVALTGNKENETSLQPGELFQFQHDRIQKAAYDQIDEQDRMIAHLKIGRLLYANTDYAERDEHLLEIIGHFNNSISLIMKKKELSEVAQLNISAGRKAKASASFDVAYVYYSNGIKLLEDGLWQNKYEFMLKLYNETIEMACLSGNYSEMKRLAAVVKKHVRTVLDEVDTYKYLIVGLRLQNRLSESISIGQEILDALGSEYPKKVSKSFLKTALEETKHKLAGKSVKDLIDLPEMTDPVVIARCNILYSMSYSAFLANTSIYVLTVLERVNLILEYGRPPAHFNFTSMSVLLCGFGEDVESGYDLGVLNNNLLESINVTPPSYWSLYIFAHHISHYKVHLSKSLELYGRCYTGSLKIGDFETASNSAMSLCWVEFMIGMKLDWVQKEFESTTSEIRKLQQQSVMQLLNMGHQAVLNLKGGANDPWRLSGPVYDEDVHFGKYIESNNRLLVLACYMLKTMLSYLFGNHQQAFDNAIKAEQYLDVVNTSPSRPVFYFYASLALLSVYSTWSEEDKINLLKKVDSNQKTLLMWAKDAPMNYLHKYHLVHAEYMRVIGGNTEDITYHYNTAINLAMQHNYLQEGALAHELTSKYWLEKGEEEHARTHMINAHYFYKQWGADRKLKYLEESYPELLSASHYVRQSSASNTSAGREKSDRTGISYLDLASLIKASQTISNEVLHDKQLMSLMTIMLENLGAQSGFLILESEGRLLVEAQANVGQDTILIRPPCPIEEFKDISSSIVNYTTKMMKDVVLDTACEDDLFKDDPHVKECRLKSALCAPIHHKSRFMGILYFENNLVSGAFTSEHIEILKLLSSQAANAVEKARLYADIVDVKEEYKGIFENAIEGIYRVTPEGMLVSANPAMARIFGFESPSSLMDVINSKGRQLFVSSSKRDELLSLLKERKNITNYETEFYRKDGNKFWGMLNARAIFNKHNELIFMEGMIVDITNQKKAVEEWHQREEYLFKENLRIRSKVKDRYKFADIVGRSPEMQEIYDLILKASATDVNIIIYGESGTGKELVAKAIHEMSGRKQGNFVPVNSGAIPENLLESEFFGYKKGAFSGAVSDKHGFLDCANGGTIFLDELGEINLNIQAKLLRAIEGGGYTPVGSTEHRKSNFRLIAATNRDLYENVKKGLMREDFFYRVHVVPIHLPPLRKRKEDIPLLIEHFLKEFKYNGDDSFPITNQFMEAMINYDWPGNVRELQNVLHRYGTLQKIEFMKNQITHSKSDESEKEENTAGTQKLGEALADFEKKYILSLLEKNKWQRNTVAAILGISRSSLFRKMETFGLMPKKKYHN
jgi:PAS domain S-box-containing protein